MTIMQQRRRANERTLGVWFRQIQQGMLKLPRFRRVEAWDRSPFLNTINNLTLGVGPALELAGVERFGLRYATCAAVDSGTMA